MVPIRVIFSGLCSALFLTGTSWCMENQDKTDLLIEQKWLDKKDTIGLYSQIAFNTRKTKDYEEGGRKLATFLPEGDVTLFSDNDDFNETISVYYLLFRIDTINQNKEKSENSRTPAFLKISSGSGPKIPKIEKKKCTIS
jgi:hypothetical protein